MLACKFGCDKLYERGMVVVGANGETTKTDKLIDPSARTYFAENLRIRLIADLGGKGPIPPILQRAQDILDVEDA